MKGSLKKRLLFSMALLFLGSSAWSMERASGDEPSNQVLAVQDLYEKYLNKPMADFFCYFDQLPAEIRRYIFSFVVEKGLKYNLELLKEFTGVGIGRAVFSPDCTSFLTGSWMEGSSHVAQVWDRDQEGPQHRLEGHTSVIESVAYSTNGEKILTGSRDGTVYLWDQKTGKRDLALAKSTSSVRSVAFSTDGKKALAGSILWDTSTGKELLSFADYGIRSAAFRPGCTDGVITHSHDWKVQLWSIQSQSVCGTISGNDSAISFVLLSPDGMKIFFGLHDGTACLWDIDSLFGLSSVYKEPVTFALQDAHNVMITSAAFSPDGEKILTGLIDGTIHFWNAKTGVHLRTLAVHRGPIVSVACSSDGKKALVSSNGTRLQLWEAKLDCPAAQWILEQAVSLQVWFILKALEAKNTQGVFRVKKDSLEYELLKTIPSFVRAYIAQWSSLEFTD